MKSMCFSGENQQALICYNIAFQAREKFASSQKERLQHGQTNSAHMLRACLVSLINATWNGRRAVVVKVVMQRAVAGSEALFFEEEWVVVECEGVEHVEISLAFVSILITNLSADGRD